MWGGSFNYVWLLDETHSSRVGKSRVKPATNVSENREGDILTQKHLQATRSGRYPDFFLWTSHVRVPMSVGVRQNGRAQKLGSCNNAAFPPSTLWCCNGTALSRNERGRMPSLHLPEPMFSPWPVKEAGQGFKSGSLFWVVFHEDSLLFAWLCRLSVVVLKSPSSC